jgi:YbbR domain-containing protein
VGSEQSEGHYKVNLEMVNVPRELALVGNVPQHVVVRLAGPRAVLSGLDERKLAYTIDLTSMQQGVSTYEVIPSRFGLPGGVEVTQVSPSKISLEADRKVKKRIPVRPRVAGVPAPGITVVSATVEPAIIEMEGPERVLKATRDVPTEVVDISGLAGNFERNVDLAPPEQSIRPSNKKEVRLEVKVKDLSPERPPSIAPQ